MKKIILLLILLGGWQRVFSQKMVSGVVRETDGAGISNVTVLQKGVNKGAVTDLTGQFTIKLDNQKPAILEFSAIGYEKKEVNVSGNRVEVILTVQNQALQEVVVVGYGTQKRVSVTGAITSVGPEEIKSAPVSSVTNALTGRVSGLVTRQESGRPGADDAQLFIRGRATFNNTSPLVLVDGIERDFTQINAEDIESVSILKDASATAVYGVRGANGVVLVTTRRGAAGKSKIAFVSEFGVTHYNRLTTYLNAETTSLFQREGTINSGLDPSVLSNTSNFPVSEYDNYLYRTQLSPFTHPDNNFVETFTKPGSQQKYNVSVSGGNKIAKYFVSVGYFTQEGMFQTDIDELRKDPTIKRLIDLSPDVDKALVQPDYNPAYYYRRLTARSNIDIQLTEDVKLGVDMSYLFKKQNRPGFYDALTNDSEYLRLFASFYRNAPQVFPIMNPNGSFAANIGVWRQNPLVSLVYTGFRSDYADQLQSTFSASYNLHKLLKGLSLDGKYAFDADWENWRGMIWRPYIYSFNNINNTYLQGLAGVLPGQASGRTAPTYDKYMELALRYRTTLGRHNISGVALVNRSSVSVPDGQYSYVPHIYQAIISRINYDFANRYLFEANMGYNGSNRFAKGHQYQLFPSVSAGWIFSNENFIPDNRIFSFGKLRSSYGKVGNDRLGDFSYYYKSTFINGGSYSFGETENPAITGIKEGRLANENITWETATKYNLGLDTRWLDSRLSFTADLFKERRTDILTTPQQYVITAGVASLAPANMGIVDNKGYELELGWQSNKKKDFSYFTKFIYSYARNKIIEMSEAAQPYPYLYNTGNPIGQFIGYKFDGFFNSYEQIAASPQQFGLTNLAPGDIKYKDLNGDGIIDQDDQAPIGNSTVPEVTGSLSAGFNYKGFDLSVLFQGGAVSSVYMVGDLGWDNSWGNYYEEHINRWTPETAQTATYPRFLQKSSSDNQNYYLSDFWLRDGKYLRLKNIQVGYTFNGKIIKRAAMNSVRVYANCFNLWTWDKVKRVDPESAPDKNNGQFYPQQRVLNVGLNVNF